MSINENYLNNPSGSFKSILVVKNSIRQDFKECYIEAKLNWKLYKTFYVQIGQLTQGSTNPRKTQLLICTQ